MAMSERQFDEWFARTHPTLWDAAFGNAGWPAADRQHALQMRRHALAAWKASRAAALEESDRICADELYAERAAERIRALGKGWSA